MSSKMRQAGDVERGIRFAWYPQYCNDGSLRWLTRMEYERKFYIPYSAPLGQRDHADYCEDENPRPHWHDLSCVPLGWGGVVLPYWLPPLAIAGSLFLLLAYCFTGGGR